MSTGYQQWDRRCAVRRATPGKIWWRTDDRNRSAPAWLSDASRSGLAFVSSAADGLVPGQTLAVSRVDPDQRNAAFETLRVCRIEPYGRGCQLVACTRIV